VPRRSDLDFSLFADTPLKCVSERVNVQVSRRTVSRRVFNILNHPNFAPPLDHRTVFDATGKLINGFGQIDTTATSSRQMQLGLKITW